MSSNKCTNQRCAACSKFIKKIPERKKIIQSTDEANAFSLCLRKNIAINDVLCYIMMLYYDVGSVALLLSNTEN